MTRSLSVGPHAADVASLQFALLRAYSDPAIDEIVVEPGRYVEHLVVRPRPRPLTIRSSTGDAHDVVISFGLCQGDRDATGMEFVQSCATLTIDSDDVILQGLTIENSFDRASRPDFPNTQAIALRTRGDRIRVDRCRILGQQDTLLLDARSFAEAPRVHLTDCFITGDVDFIYGRATALIERGEIRSTGPGYVVAPSTAAENPRGFLIVGTALTSDGLERGSVRLGRPWHPGGKPDAIGAAAFVDCTLGDHISPEPWDDMGGFRWQDARFAERGNTGAGAARSTESDPTDVDVDTFLSDWHHRARPVGTVHIVSDSTAAGADPTLAPRSGWGEAFGDASGLSSRNHAISGASARSFADTGALGAVLDSVQADDVVLIAFGHNDPKPDERFSDVFTQFPAALRRILVGARSRGAIPVLITPVERRSFDGEGRARATHGAYPDAVRALALQEQVTLVDLSQSSRREWELRGPDATKDLFLHVAPGTWAGYPDGLEDDTHFTTEGAATVAALVWNGLIESGLFTAEQ